MTDIEQLYSDYFKDVYLFALSLSHSSAAAEEITADTFFKALRSLSSFNGKSDVRVWLFSIAKNTFLSTVKKNSRLQPLESACDLAGESDPEGEACDRASAAELHRRLHSLAEPYREVFTLRVFAELPFSDIGALFGKTANWACVTYHRARNKITEMTEESL